MLNSSLEAQAGLRCAHSCRAAGSPACACIWLLPGELGSLEFPFISSFAVSHPTAFCCLLFEDAMDSSSGKRKPRSLHLPSRPGVLLQAGAHAQANALASATTTPWPQPVATPHPKVIAMESTYVTSILLSARFALGHKYAPPSICNSVCCEICSA
jgi:hypothetical protein